MDKLRVFEAFAGVGSQSMALRNIGVNYEVVGISEVDRYAILAYNGIHNASNNKVDVSINKEDMIDEFNKKNIAYNFSTGKSEIPRGINDIIKLYEAHTSSDNYGDIRLINEYNMPDFDLFTYSFPCKNISTAGKQNGFAEGSETQSSLLWECERIINHKKPKYLMMENVSNLVSKKYINDFNEWVNILDRIGYVSFYKVLNGFNFGVPQSRERVIMISIRKDIYNGFKMPEGTMTEKRFVDILENDIDENFYVSNDKYKDYIQKIISKNKSNDTKKDKQQRIGGLFDSEKQKRQAGAIWNKYGMSPTIDTMQGGYSQPLIIDGDRIRKITPLEAWRLQGFSDEDYCRAKECGLSNTKLYERAGRGIVVPMLEEIFKELFKEYICLED